MSDKLRRIYEKRTNNARVKASPVRTARATDFIVPENSTVPEKVVEMNSWVRGLIVLTPEIAVATLWVIAANGHPELLGLTAVGAAIALITSLGLNSIL